MCLGIPGQIVAISDAENRLGIVDVSGVRREINLICIVDEDHPIESCVGDWVLVHVGFAMSRIDETEAAATLQILERARRGRSPNLRRCAASGRPDGSTGVEPKEQVADVDDDRTARASIPSCTASSRIPWR